MTKFALQGPAYLRAAKRFIYATLIVSLFLICKSFAVPQAEEKKAAPVPAAPAAQEVPARDVRYEETQSPEWKANWDLARKLYREKKYREALVQYELLLSQKESVDEARWEYATLLLRQERWQHAGEQIEKLLANDPDNLEYLFAMAEVDMKTARIEDAIGRYQRLYIITAREQENIKALEGLIAALEAREMRREVQFYLEKLIALQPERSDLRLKLAGLALADGRFKVTGEILDRLEKDHPADLQVLRLQAALQRQLGNREAEACYHQKIIAVEPENTAAHAMLQQYYYDRQNWAMSLKHLEFLLKQTPQAPATLETAAELNVRLGRLDRALEYYDYLLTLNPANKDILEKKRKAQHELAGDLVVLVENDGSQMLWQDLVKVTSDRSGVYREIAGLLRASNNTDELIEVLTLICQEDPKDEQALSELADLLRQKGRDNELAALLEELHQKKNKNNPENK